MGTDEAGTLASVTSHISEVFEPAVSTHHGRIFKTMGDAVFAEFASVVDAVQCAIAVQSAMQERNSSISEGLRIEFRIGVNLGDVIIQGEDIFGDGVNVAARLEGLAEPGGICLSRAARDQIRDRIEVVLEDMGEIEVKNIARPVRAFRLKTGGAAPVHSQAIPKRSYKLQIATIALILFVAFGGWYAFTVIDTGDDALPPRLDTPRLSIAVLPFKNQSGDKDQDYLADGLTEDLTADLSRISGSFVIARGTAATYRGTTEDPLRIARELKVRYLLDGNVRRAGTGFRVGVSLIDGGTGQQVWSQRYMKQAGDIFTFQDEVTRRVARALNLELKQAVSRQVERGKIGNLDAADLALRGWAELWTKPQTPATNEAALNYVDRALALDAENAEANAVASYAYARAATYGWGMERPAAIKKGLAAGEKSVARDPKNADAFYALAFNTYLAGENRRALELFSHVIELNRNHAPAYFFHAVILLRLGQPGEAIQWLERAFALSPRDPLRAVWHAFIARAQVLLGKDESAIEAARRGIAANRNHPHNYAAMAAALAHLNRPDEANKAIKEFERVQPGIKLSRYKTVVGGKDPAALKSYARLFAGLRKAGLPE